jgi:hypothetical protein
MSIATKSMICIPCSYSTETKSNFIRHCSSKACRVNRGETIEPKEKKPTKKELAVQAALEQAALELAAKEAAELAAKEAAEQATRDDAERLLAEKVARDEHMANVIANLEAAREVIRLRDIEASKSPMDKRREGWAAATEKTLEKKEIKKEQDRAVTLAFRMEREAARAAALAIENTKKAEAKVIARGLKEDKAKLDKLEHIEEKVGDKLVKGNENFKKYVFDVCSQESGDMSKMHNAPHSLLQYISSPHRISHHLSPYYGYVPNEYKQTIKVAREQALKTIHDEASDNIERILDPTIVFDTLRGKQHLRRISEFHESIKPKPWLPPMHILKYYVFWFNGLQYDCYYDRDTMKVYDYGVTAQIGFFNENKEISFCGIPNVDLFGQGWMDLPEPAEPLVQPKFKFLIKK